MVLGFVFNEDRTRVLLIEKKRPEWQAGKINGLGGKVKGNETPHEAISREVEEESGLVVVPEMFKLKLVMSRKSTGESVPAAVKKKKISPFRREQQRIKREKLKQLRLARKERERLRKEKRAAKREAKAAPKRLMKQWAAEVAANAGHRCEVTGQTREPVLLPDGTQKISKPRKKKDGTLIPGRPVWRELDAHHAVDRHLYPQFKFDPRIGVLLTKSRHKYHARSAHKNAVWFTLWLAKNRPETYQLIVEVLGEIECLNP